MSHFSYNNANEELDCPVYYINLERRQDRNQAMVETLQEIEIYGHRINAIDSILIKDEDRFFLRSAEGACWLSHQKAIETFLEQSSSLVCLILEDDVNFDRSVNWKLFLGAASRYIVDKKFDLLQVGFLSPRYRFRFSPSRLFEYYMHFRHRYREISSPLGIIRMNEFRVGAHAYMLSREGAKKLLTVNIPPVFPADGLYAFLADVQDGRGIFKVGRLHKSLIEQYTRDQQLHPLDSDISLP